MRQVRLDIERDAVERHPAPHPHADGGDLVFRHLAVPARFLVGTRDPDADPVLADLAPDVEQRQRRDDPGLQRRDIGAHVLAAAVEVEHRIGDALAGAVIGELPAAPGLEHRKTRIDQVLRFCRRAGGIKRRMLDQPDQFGGAPLGDVGDARLHEGDGVGIGH